MLWILDFENVTGERIRSLCQSLRLRSIEIRQSLIDTSPIRTDYTRRNTKVWRRVAQTLVLVISLCVSAETLTEATEYTALDEHDHINVGKQLESYARMF